MAAGPGADVGDAALLLFAQTAAERADTQPRQQVCLKTPHWQKGLLFYVLLYNISHKRLF